jgi:peroxiredoxin
MPKVAIEAEAPDFELADFGGAPFWLSGLRGSNVLLVFNRGFT